LNKSAGRVPLNNANFMLGVGSYAQKSQYFDTLPSFLNKIRAKKEIKNEYDQIIPYPRLG
jgi:hypothetical protein